jgi:hypothetical protein
MDFIEGLPKSKHFDSILVVIDKFTKYAHFIPMSHPFTSQTVAQAFFNNIYKLHGLSQVIILDRDKIFTSSFWQELFRLAETTLNMSSSCHPQTDGQSERLNQCFETYLRCMTHASPAKWANWISLAEFWCNINYHSAHNKTPSEVLYGHPPRHFMIAHEDQCKVPDVEQWLADRAEMGNLIKQNPLRAQARMKEQADKKRQEQEFQIGDWVYLKLQPYVQMSVVERILMSPRGG